MSHFLVFVLQGVDCNYELKTLTLNFLTNLLLLIVVESHL